MYRLGIWLIAFALVFNGVAAYCMDDHPGPTANVQGHHDKLAGDDCDIQRGDTTPRISDCGASDHRTHNHLKCCGICNVASLISGVRGVLVPYSYAAVSFRTVPHKLVGHLVRLDPHIPKSSV